MFSRILVVIAVGLAAYLAYVFFQVFERVEEKVDLGWQAKARKNPYLAVQLLEESNGRELSVFDSVQKIGSLEDYDFIYLADSKLLLSESRLSEILDWVKAGGHLMVRASAQSDTYADKLLDTLELSIEDTDYNDFFSPFDDVDDDQDADAEDQDSDQPDPKEVGQRVADELRRYNENLQKNTVTAQGGDLPSVRESLEQYDQHVDNENITYLNFGDDDYSVKVELNVGTQLSHPAMYDEDWEQTGQRVIYWKGTDYGVHFIQIEFEYGLVSVMTDSALFDSGAVGHLDHAHLWEVLSGDRSAIIYGSNMPGLFTIIWRAMPELSLALLALLLFKIWQVAGHFGPQKPELELARRSFHEHLLASAGFLWRHQRQAKLLSPLREEIITLATARITGFHSAKPEAQIGLLAEHSEIAPDIVRDAMLSEKPLTEDGFTKLVQVLQELRKSL